MFLMALNKYRTASRTNVKFFGVISNVFVCRLSEKQATRKHAVVQRSVIYENTQ